MDNETYQIVSVYHKHVNCDLSDDVWSRQRVHGLNRNYLRTHGFDEVCNLVSDFESWLKSLVVVAMFANAPDKERQLLPYYRIHDLLLPPWQERIDKPYHLVANRFKDLSVPIKDVRCDKYVHSEYRGIRGFIHNKTQAIKLLHGYHCSLYDCFELYLFYLLQTQYL